MGTRFNDSPEDRQKFLDEAKKRKQYVKERIALVDLVEEVADRKSRRFSSYTNFDLWGHKDCLSVFHDGAVEDQHFEHWAGGANGDIFDWMEYAHGVSFWDALKEFENRIGGQAPSTYQLRDRSGTDRKEGPPPDPPTWNDVMEAFVRADLAAPYWMSRGIMKDTIYFKRFGVTKDRRGYMMQDGKVLWHEFERYTIPNFRPHPVTRKMQLINMNRRLNPKSVENLLQDSPTVQTVLDDIFERDGRYPDQDDLVKAICGPKYMMKGPWNIYNGHILYDYKADGTWALKRRDSILLMEGEASADALTDYFGEDGGYPAIAVKYDKRFDIVKALSQVNRIYFAYDDDSAGYDYAISMRKKLGRGQVIPIPDPHNDPNDIAMARGVEQWLAPYNIDVLPRADLVIPVFKPIAA